MKTRTVCKFKCTEVTESIDVVYDKESAEHEGRILYGATMDAVISGSAENEEFFAFTPAGTFEVQSITKKFEVGKEYYIEITEFEEIAETDNAG